MPSPSPTPPARPLSSTPSTRPAPASPPNELTPHELLVGLGVHLSPSHALLLLASLAAERPILLMGLPGQAKTQLVRALGDALAKDRTRVLNAALTSFDDVRGFIRPSSLDLGHPEIIPGPWSPYRDELLFVDELSRAPSHQQSRWLQLLHERLIDGQPTSLRWVLAAMNPPSVDGTFPLGLATADRFLAVLTLEDFGELDPTLRLRITMGELTTDAPDLRAEATRQLPEYLGKIRAEHTHIQSDALTRLALGRVVDAALEAFRATPGAPFSPQGRRAVLLFTLITWALAALRVHHEDRALERLGELLDPLLVAGLIDLGRACACDEAALDLAHDEAYRAADRVFETFVHQGGREALVDDALERNDAAAITRLALTELERPTLDVRRASRVLEAWWSASLPATLATPTSTEVTA